MEEIGKLIGKAMEMLAKSYLDREAYSALENYVLKNGSRLKDNPEFRALKEKLGEVANKFGIPGIDSVQENFGANSCAQ